MAGVDDREQTSQVLSTNAHNTMTQYDDSTDALYT